MASCVVFKNGKPSKRDYRHFNIKTVEGPDDFASTHRGADSPLQPVVGGGAVVASGGGGRWRKRAVSSAVEAFDRLGIRGKVALVGIAKRLEEIYFPGDSVPLYIDKNSESLRVIQQTRATRLTGSESLTIATAEARGRRSLRSTR